MTDVQGRRRAGGRLLATSLATLMVSGLAPGVAGALATTVPLTDGRTFAHWAHPQYEAPAHRFPNAASAVVARTHFETEDGYAEVYAVLRRTVDPHGRAWFKIGIPGRPNNRTGWVREHVLGPTYGVKTRLVVDRTKLRATLYRAGKPVWTSRIGVGAASTPTPVGAGWIREKFRVRDRGGPYGPFAIGTSSYSVLSDWPGGGVIGIHGTDRPDLIPGRPSHGCVRVPNRALGQLYGLMPLGTPFVVL